MPPASHINNVQLSQEEVDKYLGLHLDRRLTWHKHIFVKWKHHTIKYWLLRRKLKFSTSNKLLIQYSNQSELIEYHYGVQLPLPTFSRGFPIESLAHDSVHTKLPNDLPTRFLV
jgi:hypothetical protein